jgi:WD40 repeat protein
MSVRKILILTTLCLGFLGCLFVTAEILCGRKSITFYGHTSFVSGVVISPDGKTLASGSADHTVKLWDVATGRERATFKGHTENVHSVAFSPDGKTLASGSLDETVKLWDVATGQELNTLPCHTSAFIGGPKIAFSPDGKTLASGGGFSETTVTLWDVGTGRRRATLQHTEGITSVVFSPTGRTLASGSWDGTVRLWDVATGQQRGALRANPKAWTNSIAFSPDGKTLACGNADAELDRSEVMLWDLASGQERKRLTLSKYVDESYVGYVTFSPDGKTLVAIELPRTIHLWDIGSGKNTANFDWNYYDKPFGAFLNPLIDKLPTVFHRHDEFSHCYSVFFRPNGKFAVLGDGQFWDSGKQDWCCTAKLLELATIPNTKK